MGYTVYTFRGLKFENKQPLPFNSFSEIHFQ